MAETVKTKSTFLNKVRTITQSSVFEKIRTFMNSDIYTITLFVLASLAVVFKLEVLGTMIFANIIMFSVAICKNYLPAFQAVMLVICFAIRCKNSFDDFVKIWWLAIPMVLFVVMHFVFYSAHLKKGACTWGIVATSVAVTLGGLGSISAKEYFSSNALFYVILLGFGMLIIYMFFSAELNFEKPEEIADKFTKTMMLVIFFLCVCIAEEYVDRIDEFLKNPGVLPFQWRNNASTMLMLAMPFPLYFSIKKFRFFAVGILAYVAIMFTGSRGGLLFGFIELTICIVVMFVINKKNRKKLLIVIVGCIILLLIISPFVLELLEYTLSRFVTVDENKIRLGMFRRGIEDFLSSPVFGKGIGYMGNSDIHKNAKFTLCWYHCSPIQIMGSFGIVGILAYGYLLFVRIRIYIKNISFFNTVLLLSYVGLEMMSLVNPGIFSPFPYLFMATIYFVMMEHYGGKERKEHLQDLLRGKV